ncbi:Endonuclease/exonuclease/phosphatase [Kribbella flavida DSM 17836]|uniref:Endonuclease/exonuclease/phosphatase n=1 Tax=Kribbella flavida (strain DSM 17836 / JCM 10339 / NBRC 14399) TaxID=479435 RepID=D2PNW1_KRIFD|nr:lamin tail domain-containing protein [Kribbella flavida]ADB32779.1 Endonuclease/exonuclease/phosphatase [Kribbella flavida DSM 17836]
MSAQIRSRRRLGALVVTSALVLPGAVAIAASSAQAASSTVVITEVYGGGGNTGAPYQNDFVELTNNSTSPVDLTGWSIQYASSAGVSWSNKVALTGSIAPGGVYLARLAGGTTGQPLPEADVVGGVNMSASSGKVALVTSTTSLTCTTGCATANGVVDFVGYGGANDAEGSPAPGPSNTTSVTRKVPTTDSDNNASDFAAVNPSPKTLTSTPPDPDPVPAKIHDIQGAAHRSPLNGKLVGDVTGVVTAKSGNGFWFQDTQPDADPATSEGLFVFTSSAPAVAVGDAVSVQGTVTEFRPGGSGGTDNLTTTELTNPKVTVTTPGGGAGAVPAPTIVGPGGRVPPSTVIDDDSTGDVETTGTFQPATDGIDFWESLEGMWLGIDRPEVTGPISSFRELSVVPAGSGVRTIRGGIVLQKTDSNPERVLLDDLLAPVPDAKTGDTLVGPDSSTVTGVLDYGFGNFKFLVTRTPTVIDGGITRERTAPSSALQVSVATFNVENLDPSDGPAKFDGLAQAVVKNLASPDILALEEVQDNDGATNSGSTGADLTLNTLAAAIRAAGGPKYAWRQIDPVDGEEGGEPGGNIRVAFMYRTDRPVKFVDRPGGGSTTATAVTADKFGRPHLSASPGRVDPANPAWASARVPLAGEFSWHGQSLFVVVNHFSSKGGDDPLWGRTQPPVQSSAAKRHEQARSVRGFVDQILAKDRGANVIVLGDINDFEFSTTTDILVGSGRTTLTSLPRTLPAKERYSYVFEGNSQILDQILISQNLRLASSYDIVHMNAEFPDQISDHDPQVVRVVPLPSWYR